tara:strand:- start:412 stop:741 length:330 start_codon:yes stop_codon:yes gene_type:complete
MKKIAADRNYKIMKKAGMKVYVLVTHMRDVDETDIYGVYSSLEKAEIAKKKEYSPGSQWCTIEEFVVDEYEEEEDDTLITFKKDLPIEEEERVNKPSFPGNGRITYPEW